MKEIFNLGIYLFIICMVAAAALAGTNSFTSQKIAEHKIAVEREALKEVLPAASKFEEKKGFPKKGYDDKGEVIGYILKVAPKGYSSQIEALVGIDKEYRVVGVNILSQTETPGLGAKIVTKSFLSQFVGRGPDKIFIKKDNKNGEIDAITAATISSRAITNAIREKIDEFKRTNQ